MPARGRRNGTHVRLERFGVVPRFYFHLYNDIVAMDDEGRELADAGAAHEVAVHSAREMAAESVRKGRVDLKHRIEVADAQGECVLVVHFRDVVTVED